MVAPLLTINDLDTISDSDKAYHLTRIAELGDMYEKFVAHDPGGYAYTVDIGREDARSPGLHASEMSGCMRRLVYSLSGLPRKADATNINPNMKMRFKVGHGVHAFIQNDFHRIADSRSDLLFEDEVRIDSSLGGVAAEHDVSSSCDGLFTFLTHGVPVLRLGLEIKTKSHGMYEKMKKPDKEHLEQTNIYMKTLDVPLMWTLYINKSNAHFTKPKSPYLFQVNQELWDDQEIHIIHARHLASKYPADLPDREESLPCSWCPWSYECKPSFRVRGGGSNKNRRPLRRTKR